MNKLDLALNNLQWLIWRKTKPNQINVKTAFNTNQAISEGTIDEYTASLNGHRRMKSVIRVQILDETLHITYR